MTTALPILYEDAYLLVVNKPARMPAHGGRGGGLADLLATTEEQLGRRLTLFHRLDVDTTGVVVLGKDRSIQAAMAEMFASKRIRKAYWAVVRGRWRSDWNRIETRIDRDAEGRYRNVVTGGRVALSTCRVLRAGDAKSWIEVLPKTGRTHQVRLHCLAMGCPILGDPKYGERGPVPIALHAWRIDFAHPATGARLRVRAAPPAYWADHWLADLDAEQILARSLSD